MRCATLNGGKKQEMLNGCWMEWRKKSSKNVEINDTMRMSAFQIYCCCFSCFFGCNSSFEQLNHKKRTNTNEWTSFSLLQNGQNQQLNYGVVHTHSDGVLSSNNRWNYMQFERANATNPFCMVLRMPWICRLPTMTIGLTPIIHIILSY